MHRLNRLRERNAWGFAYGYLRRIAQFKWTAQSVVDFHAAQKQTTSIPVSEGLSTNVKCDVIGTQNLDLV
jgi:hypothetical protein